MDDETNLQLYRAYLMAAQDALDRANEYVTQAQREQELTPLRAKLDTILTPLSRKCGYGR